MLDQAWRLRPWETGGTYGNSLDAWADARSAAERNHVRLLRDRTGLPRRSFARVGPQRSRPDDTTGGNVRTSGASVGSDAPLPSGIALGPALGAGPQPIDGIVV